MKGLAFLLALVPAMLVAVCASPALAQSSSDSVVYVVELDDAAIAALQRGESLTSVIPPALREKVTQIRIQFKAANGDAAVGDSANPATQPSPTNRTRFNPMNSGKVETQGRQSRPGTGSFIPPTDPGIGNSVMNRTSATSPAGVVPPQSNAAGTGSTGFSAGNNPRIEPPHLLPNNSPRGNSLGHNRSQNNARSNVPVGNGQVPVTSPTSVANSWHPPMIWPPPAGPTSGAPPVSTPVNSPLTNSIGDGRLSNPSFSTTATHTNTTPQGMQPIAPRSSQVRPPELSSGVATHDDTSPNRFEPNGGGAATQPVQFPTGQATPNAGMSNIPPGSTWNGQTWVPPADQTAYGAAQQVPHSTPVAGYNYPKTPSGAAPSDPRNGAIRVAGNSLTGAIPSSSFPSGVTDSTAVLTSSQAPSSDGKQQPASAMQATDTSTPVGAVVAEAGTTNRFNTFLWFLLFCSVGLNIYLGWIARGFYARYHELGDELRESFTHAI